jgi:hypothetical protein
MMAIGFRATHHGWRAALAAVPAFFGADASSRFSILRGSLTNLYVLVAFLAAGMGFAGYIAFRSRRASEVDQVSANVLDRIRTEYR